jgi:capsular polysaccharide biosynthesis protein
MPFGVIATSFTIDTKIHTEEDILKQINDAAFLGTIPQVLMAKVV